MLLSFTDFCGGLCVAHGSDRRRLVVLFTACSVVCLFITVHSVLQGEHYNDGQYLQAVSIYEPTLRL